MNWLKSVGSSHSSKTWTVNYALSNCRCRSSILNRFSQIINHVISLLGGQSWISMVSRLSCNLSIVWDRFLALISLHSANWFISIIHLSIHIIFLLLDHHLLVSLRWRSIWLPTLVILRVCLFITLFNTFLDRTPFSIRRSFSNFLRWTLHFFILL